VTPVERFPAARCAPCGRDVLLVLVLDADGRERRLCAHCDAEIDPAEIRWLAADAMETLGYHAYDEAENCGRPDCGGGRCG